MLSCEHANPVCSVLPSLCVPSTLDAEIHHIRWRGRACRDLRVDSQSGNDNQVGY